MSQAITIIGWLALLVFVGWTGWNYYRVRKAATFLTNEAFKQELKGGQLLDLRDAQSFKTKHILGARNFPQAQFKESLSALRKDKPVLLYDASRGTNIARTVLTLKKAGFQTIYVLKDGFDYWDGKTK